MKKTISLLLTLVLCLSLCACGHNDAYDNANACFSQGRYEEAAKLYIEAGKYKDSNQKLLEIYYVAVNCYESKAYDEAYSLFVILNEIAINESAKYIALLERHFSFVEALENARNAFTEYDVFSGFEWLNQATVYATEEEQGIIAELKLEISDLVYEDTQFITFDTFLSEKPVGTETIEGKCTWYLYYQTNPGEGFGFEDIHKVYKAHYDSNYTKIARAEIPKWIVEVVGDDSCVAYYDNWGNIIAWDFAMLFSDFGYTTMDVFVFYADYVKSMS